MEGAILITLILAAGLALSFLFSGMEAGVLALNRLRIRQQMKAGRRGARLLHGYLENPENFLWTILIGNTLANFTVVCLMVAQLHRFLHGRLLLLAPSFAILVLLFYVLCDLLPKMLFRAFPNRLCLALAVPFRFLHAGLSPLVRLFEWFSNTLLQWTGGKIFRGHLFGSRAELRLVMQESSQSLTSEERAMINRVLDLQNISLRSITIPIDRVTAVGADAGADELLRIITSRNFSRLPVWQGQGAERRITGVISQEDMIYAGPPEPGRRAADFMRPALFLDEGVRLEEALRQMQRGGDRLAIVLGLDKKEIGIVSLRDVLKTIFGEVSL